MSFTGKTALITGSARGIGQALSMRLAELGCDIIGCDLNVKSQADTKVAVQASGKSYKSYAADLSDSAKARAMIDRAIKAGGFDILINCAGIATSGPYDQADFERWEKTIGINLVGTMATCHAALPHFKNKDAGHIVNISSIAGLTGSPGLGAYCASKFGVYGFTQSLEYELMETNIHTTRVHPTMVKTRMIDDVGKISHVPIIEIEQVVEAIIDAIQTKKRAVYIPKSMKFKFEILPRFMPGLMRKMLSTDETSESWQNTNKDIPEN